MIVRVHSTCWSIVLKMKLNETNYDYADSKTKPGVLRLDYFNGGIFLFVFLVLYVCHETMEVFCFG